MYCADLALAIYFIFLIKASTSGYFTDCFYQQDVGQPDIRLEKRLLRGGFGRAGKVGIRTSDAGNVSRIL